MAKSRAKRGRLSSIDLLPPECDEDVAWVVQELQKRKRTQEEIREEFNLRLLSKGADPVSSSAFNRYALANAVLGRRLAEAQAAAAALGERLDQQPDADIGLLVNQTLKTLLYDIVIDHSLSEESPSLGMVKEAAQAIERIERARRANIAAAVQKRREFVASAADEAEKVARAKGIDEETIAEIRERVLRGGE